jgi:hypothetical protein
MSEIENILRNTGLIEEIEKQSKIDGFLKNFAKNTVFKSFIKALDEDIEKLVNDDDSNNNDELLTLLNEVSVEINKKLNSGEKKMIIETVILLSLTAGGIYLSKQQKNRSENTSSVTRVPSYKQHQLLIVIHANRLPNELKSGQNISNDKLNELIANTVRCYCFSVDNEEGNKVMEGVECSDTPIDFTTENRVFVQLELSAEAGITNQRDKLSIRAKIKPNSTATVQQIKNLQSARSTSNFYQI